MSGSCDMNRNIVKIGFIGGSGLNDPNILENRVERQVDTIFGKPSDVLVEGQISGVNCVLLARHGRKHTIMPSNVNYRANIWALKDAGCTHVIASTATGSLKENIKPGDLVILDSFIDRTTKRTQTFYDGAATSLKGVCHIPMEPAFCQATRKILIDAATQLKYSFHPKGTCVTIEGPRFSSKAESHMFRSWNADLVNMTTVPEVVLAKEAGLCYAAVAMATDYDCWKDERDLVCVEEVMKVFARNVDKMTALFKYIVPKIQQKNWDEELEKVKKTAKSGVMPHE